MLQRILSTLSPDTTSTNLLRLNWIEALRTPGCALCLLAQRKSQRYIETLLHEAVTDADQRDTWRQTRGLCHWHAWMATETPHSNGSLALLYADVLRHDLGQLTGTHCCRPSHTALAGASLAGCNACRAGYAPGDSRGLVLCALCGLSRNACISVCF